MTSELEAALEQVRQAAVAMLDAATVELTRKLYLLVSYEELQQPAVAAVVDELHTKILAWRELKLAELEAARLAAGGRLH